MNEFDPSGETKRGAPLLAAWLCVVLAGCGGGDDAAAAGNGSGGTTGGSSSGGGSGQGQRPASCGEAAREYSIETEVVLADTTPTAPGGGFGSARNAYLPLAVADDGSVYMGLNTDEGATVVRIGEGKLFTLPGARLGGMAATAEGVSVLAFDAEERRWAAVHRFSAAGQEQAATDLFRSANLEDEGTKGEAGSSRLGYLSASDDVVAYFGHTQRHRDGVRHQGGYLATVDGAGEQELLSGWFGSHNLDQRLWTSGSEGAALGLGDAYPIGIFFARLGPSPRPRVVYRLAAAGNGTANGQLGGLVEVEDELIAPFITNLDVSPDLDAGEWPDIDQDVSDRIRAAANAGKDLGLLRIPKSGDLPEGDVPTVWLEPDLAEGARLERLKSAPYGSGKLVLLLWGETTGGNRDSMTSYYTMVVDVDGNVCQPKKQLDSAHAVTVGDDLVRAPDGSLLWVNDVGGSVRLLRLVP